MTNRTYWFNQADKPLYPDIIWSKPENRTHAGKLLIIGGHAHGFAAPAECYQRALEAGAGSVRVLIPDHIRKQLSRVQGPSLELEYAPSTPSGSFAHASLATMIDNAAWADSIIFAGDLGRNSETAIVLEKFVTKTKQNIVITKDAVDYFTTVPQTIINRPHTTLVLSIAQLQKLLKNASYPETITYGMDLMHLVDTLHTFTTNYRLHIVVKHHDTIVVAVNGFVSSTKTEDKIEEIWRVPVASRVAVWLMQNPSKPFEAITSAIYKNE